MYNSFERRPTATEEKLSQYSGKLRIERRIDFADSESEEEKSSRSNASRSASGGYR